MSRCCATTGGPRCFTDVWPVGLLLADQPPAARAAVADAVAAHHRIHIGDAGGG
eukprot:gene15049-58997_t